MKHLIKSLGLILASYSLAIGMLLNCHAAQATAQEVKPNVVELLKIEPKVFKTSDVLKTEIRQLIALLQQYHYNRDAVRPTKFNGAIREFMKDFDSQRLFFLNSDLADFEKRFGSSLYYNLNDLGNIDAGYEIFYVYRNRIQARVAWIMSELNQEIDLSSKDYYRVDRSKSDWPENSAAADELWKKRLKFELLGEVLNKKTMVEARQNVRKRYERMLKNIAELEGAEVAEIYLSSICKLFDPHSSYLSADSYEEFGVQMKLQLVGIGALLGIEEDICVVKEVVPGGPVDLSKALKPNDKILAVAQEGEEPVDIIGMRLRKIVNMIRGKKGSLVKLIVQPGDAVDSSTRREVVITRDVVKLNSARAHAAVFDVPAADGKTTASIGVISLPAFYGGEDQSQPGEKISASKDVAELLNKLQTEGVQGIVLDLRRNGGGLLSEAISLTGLFINSGPVVQVKNYENKIDVDGDDDPRIAYAGPLAVLVDRFSASASEIVAGALQNYGRAIVIGDSSTHGKGTVQTLVEMRGMIPRFMRTADKTGAAKLTIQKFYLPSGASTQMKGVIPDIILPSWEDYLEMIGERDLPNALVWDEVKSSFFDGKPLPQTLIATLKEGSLQRQNELEEFSFLRKNIDWFKTKQEQKLVSLQLAERQKIKEADKAFDKENKAERARLEKTGYAFREVRLVPPPPPRIKAPAKKEDAGEDEDDELISTDQEEGYKRLDVHLRESLRVLSDALNLGRDPIRWAHEYAPLTAQAVKGS